jgi:hypothetical protein
VERGGGNVVRRPAVVRDGLPGFGPASMLCRVISGGGPSPTASARPAPILPATRLAIIPKQIGMARDGEGQLIDVGDEGIGARFLEVRAGEYWTRQEATCRTVSSP